MSRSFRKGWAFSGWDDELRSKLHPSCTTVTFPRAFHPGESARGLKSQIQNERKNSRWRWSSTCLVWESGNHTRGDLTVFNANYRIAPPYFRPAILTGRAILFFPIIFPMWERCMYITLEASRKILQNRCPELATVLSRLISGERGPVGLLLGHLHVARRGESGSKMVGSVHSHAFRSVAPTGNIPYSPLGRTRENRLMWFTKLALSVFRRWEKKYQAHGDYYYSGSAF